MGRALLLTVAALFGLGCADNTPVGAQLSCRSNDYTECVDFVSGFTEDTARGLCDIGSSTFSAASACPSGRGFHCTATVDGVVVVSWYLPITMTEASARCDALGGDFVSDI